MRMSPRTIAQMNPVTVDWRNYQTVLWTRETSCVERDVASARATSQMVFTSRAKARISSQVLATIVAKLATRLRSAGPGMELPKVRGKNPSANVTSSGKGKSKGKWKSSGKRRSQSGRPAGSTEFEVETWEETNETEQEQWWNSWTEDEKPKRDEAPLGALVVGGAEFHLNSFKTASGEILPDEGQLLWPCFLQDGRKCRLRGHVTDVHKPLISAGNVLDKGRVAILHSNGGSILSWDSPTGNLISRAMTKGTAGSDELIKLYRESNIYNFYVKGFDGNWRAQNFDTGAAVSVLPRQLLRVNASVVGRQPAGSVGQSRSQGVSPIEAAASSSGSCSEQNTDMDDVTELRDPRAPSGQEEDDEFQRPRGVRFHDEQKYPVSREEREEHELLGHVQYRSWCRHCAVARGVGQQHRPLSEDPMDATVPEIVLDYYFMGEESETAPHIVVKDRKSSAYFSTSLDSKTLQYAVAFVAGAIQELGYKRILMKSDNKVPSND